MALIMTSRSNLPGRALDDPQAKTVLVTAHEWGRLQILYQTEQRQHLEDMKCWVDLRPPKCLADAALVAMAIIAVPMGKTASSQLLRESSAVTQRGRPRKRASELMQKVA